MTTQKTKTKTNSAEDFIKRKNEYFKKNSVIKVKDIGRKGVRFFFREAWTFMLQSNLNEKVLFIERLRKEGLEGKIARRYQWKKGDIEYRIGYYIVGRIGRAKGRWVWGQFCPLIPAEDLKKLLEKAKKEKTIT
ncbi:hypothetical protein FJZ40_01395 [Candidatus Shapirobacteria bacterium]|nr:hypothetical protein [Candidatus Shapirobacteria bacterium]MBM3283379.1 hypothetical protein [Candidatus Gottesmanbacteria bacterium]